MAARYGHSQVLDTLREVTSLRITSKKLGLYALHVAAHYGQPGEHRPHKVTVTYLSDI